MTIGYLHPEYVRSFAEFGRPRQLRQCGGWILERAIPGAGCSDAIGCYPLFACSEWSLLKSDLDALSGELVSLCLVTDPFGHYDEALLKMSFSDLVVPFKNHFVIDLTLPVERTVSKHHRYYARKALRTVEVECCSRPESVLDDWCRLYAKLICRHGLSGIKAFSRAAFEMQLQIPGMVVLRAVHRNTTVGAHLWYVQNGVAYSHLAAFDDQGYDLNAAYALYWTALQTFAARVRWLDIGAGAGAGEKAGQGLTFFKRGWATGTKTAYLCGRIFNRPVYDDLTRARCAGPTDYFPAYRQEELL